MNKQELISIIRTEILLAKSSPERKGYIAGLEEAISIIEGFSDSMTIVEITGNSPEKRLKMPISAGCLIVKALESRRWNEWD